MSLLERIQEPADLKAVPEAELPALAEEIRAFLVDQVSRTGGHLGPNLGVVELTMAIHRVFDSPRDAIVFDTGHQSYVHKLLTGRQDFSGLRQQGGLSGYPSRAESAHDVVESSHASSSEPSGRSGGEASTEAATSQRFANSAGGFMGALGVAGQVAATGLGMAVGAGTRAATLGADLTNQMGVGHNTYIPDFSSSRSRGRNNAGPSDQDNPEINGSGPHSDAATPTAAPPTPPTPPMPQAPAAPAAGGPGGAGPSAGAAGAGGAGAAAGGGAAASVPIVPV